MESKVRVILVRSLIGRHKKHIRTAEALGLTKIRDSREININKATQGMIDSISYLLRVGPVA